MFRFLGKLRRNKLDHLLTVAAKESKKRFLIPWNRGLGDIALGLYALVHRIKTYIPDAEITFLTRDELKDAFGLLENINVISVPWWQRGIQTDLKNTIQKLGIKETYYDVILDKVNPTKWLSWQRGKLTPKLKWQDKYDVLWQRFALDNRCFYIAAHINTETQQFYGYKKDWSYENWITLFKKLSEKSDIRIILFGLNKTNSFDLPSIIDLRGDTDLLEMLSIIKNLCTMLVAPDGGVLSLIYYLDVYFPIKIISLWGDANQGIMKQSVPSPNKGLLHIPIIGEGKDISRIDVEKVLRQIKSCTVYSKDRVTN